MRKPPKPAPISGKEKAETAATPSEIKTIPAAVSTARAGRPVPDAQGEQIARSQERFAERVRLRRRLTVRRYLIVTAVVIAALTGVWVMFFSSVFTLDKEKITIIGAGEFVEKSEVLRAVDAEIGVPLAQLDVEEISDRIDQVRGVASSIVRRDWPRGVRISLAQRTPVAAVKSKDVYVLLDVDGVRVGETEEVPADLAQAQVPLDSGRESSLAAVLTVLDEIPMELRQEIVDIGADTRDTVYFTLEDESRVEWGSSDDSALKASVLAVLRQESANVYDVSAPTLPVTRD